MSSPQIPHILNLDLKLQFLRPAPHKDELANAPQSIAQGEIVHRSVALPEVADGDYNLVVVQELVGVDEEALGDGGCAFAVVDEVVNDAYGQGDYAEEFVAGDRGAEGVEEEGDG